MEQENRAHRAKTEKTSKKKLHANGYNAKAFTMASPGAALKQMRRAAEMKEKRYGSLMVDRTPEEPPPVIVAVVGPKGTGKTTLIKSLVRRYTKHTLTEINGPITVVSGKRRRLTFMECGTDLNSMIDVAKCADLVLLMLDGNFGFEMETMEFLNILSPHGFPRILGITTHLDLFKKSATMRSAKQALKKRFWTEVYQGAKLFYLSGVINGRYPDREIINLARFISVMKFKPSNWRNEHPYLLADRVEDITHPSLIESNLKVDRTIAFYGYVHGSPLPAEHARVHIPGLGDLTAKLVERLPDPCPTPHAIKMEEERERAERKAGSAPVTKKRHRKLDEKSKTIYAPMSDVGGVMIDKDAVYIDVGTSNFTAGQEKGVGEKLVTDLQTSGRHLDGSDLKLQIFGEGDPEDEQVSAEDIEELDLDDMDALNENIDEVDESHPDFGDSGRTQVREGKTASAAPKEDDESEVPDEDLAFASDSELGDDELKWMNNFKPASSKKKFDLGKMIYADVPAQSVILQLHGEEGSEDEGSGDEDDFFTKKREENEVSSSSFLTYPNIQNWSNKDQVESIADIFYREVKLKESDGEDGEDGEIAEDFEDLEADNKDSDHETEVENMEAESKNEQIVSVEEQRAENARRKEKLRLQIEEGNDQEGEDFEENAAEDAWFDRQKANQEKQKEINNAEYNQMDDATRDKYEGYRAGAYVRIVFDDLPYEFIENFDPKYPTLIGGLLANEDRFGFSQVRIKRHRWHKKILKTNDPLIISLGWRRFQTCPIYTTSDSRTRNRLLKYTPEHMHCTATFYGPLVSPNTGFCAVNSVSDNDKRPGFRISATGTVQEVDSHVEIVKKLKLVGYPYKIFKNTAFVKDMFSSSIEAAKFEGASIKTVSGIRGQIKRALAKPEGNFRATFEDKILMSDIIILRAWFPIQARKFYNPVTSLLLKDKENWKGMQLTGTVRAQRGIETPSLPGSKYGKVERNERKFNPLKVPDSLKSQLPFGSQLHQMKPQRKKTYMQKRAVVLDGEEKKLRELMIKVATLRNEKDAKRKAKKDESRARIAAAAQKIESEKEERRREARKEYFIAQGKREAAEKSESAKKRRK